MTSGLRAAPSFDEEDHRLARRHRLVLYRQITEDHVSFDHIVQAWGIRYPQGAGAAVDPEEEQVSRFLECLARKEFSQRHGGIEKDFWSRRPWAACALTGDGWVHSVLNAEDSELILIDSGVHQLCRDAHRIFGPVARRRRPPGRNPDAGPEERGPAVGRRPDRPWRDGAAKAWQDLTEIGEMLYSVLTRVNRAAQALESEEASSQEQEDARKAVRAEWASVRATVEGMIQRQARFEYFIGVGLGALAIIPLLVGGGWLAATFGGRHFSDPVAFTAALLGGAAGAVISVTQRMTAGTLMIDFAAPKRQKILLGTLRPLVGAVLAGVVCFAIMGGLLAVEAKSGTQPSIALAFYTVAGFAAGFSERLATDVLEGASAKLVPAARD